jgi:hypothetical protein
MDCLPEIFKLPKLALDNSTHAQRNRLLDALRCGPVSTITARGLLDIMMPGTRVYELRHRYGHPIEKIWVWQETELGKPHRVAQYFLLANKSESIHDKRQDD